MNKLPESSFASNLNRKKLNKKRRKLIFKIITFVLIVVIILLFAMSKTGLFQKNNLNNTATLSTYTVSTKNITQIITSTGTIEPKNQYTINALVSGEIIDDYFEEGDSVTEDQLLYKIDSDSLNSNVTRAENLLKNARKSLETAQENLEKLNVESDYTGIVEKLYVEVGDEVNAGTLLADIRDSDTMCIDIPFMEADITSINIGDTAILSFDTYEQTNGIVTKIGKVKHVNSLGVTIRNVTISAKNFGSITTSSAAYAQIGDVYCTGPANFYYNDEGQVFAEVGGTVKNIYFDEGSKTVKGSTIILLESKDLEDQVEKLQDSVKEAEDSLEDANDAFDNYNIQAPITGKVISKSYKSGDTISQGQGGATLAVIYDMSSLKFSMNIDELDIDKIDKGQEVIITCDSREGKEYYGIITNISIQGVTSNGTTVYPVEVTIENIEDVSQRKISDDGTISKVYKTGMTSTENTYILEKSERISNGTKYTYSNGTVISVIQENGGTLVYDGEKLLNTYLNNTYTQGSNFYSFSNDYRSMNLEIQNDKKMLRPGMNIDASIVVENRQNVIAVPIAAVGRGNIVKVLKNNNYDEHSNNKQIDDNFNNKNTDKSPEYINPKPTAGKNKGYGTADENAEFTEVKVNVGISDDDYVEITQGLKAGDIVIIDNAYPSSQNSYMQYGMMGTGGMPSNGMMGMGTGMPSSANMGGQRPSMGMGR